MREWADRLPEEIPDGAKLLNDVHSFLRCLPLRTCADRTHAMDRAHTPDGLLGFNAQDCLPVP